MKKTILTLVSFFVAIIFVQAQENSSPEKYSYSNVTEFGFTTTGPEGIAFEATTVHGFALNKQHCIGFGVGFGVSSLTSNALYTPMFINYRLYFRPDKTFSPHVNIAAGGILIDEGQGFMASVTSGFKSRKFSLSSGLSFMAIKQTYSNDYYWGTYQKWVYPFGVTIKVGFTF